MHKLRTGHLFAGAGGGILADLLLRHQPIFAVEIEDYPRKVLEQRQADGVLPFFPTFGDIKDFDGTPWRGTVDVLCGGFPCQDISAAGKGAGITGERSGLWKEYARLIGEMRPRFVFAENSPLLRTRGLGVVLEDLASLGYNARWGVLGARDVGAPHKRDRMWVLAYAKGAGVEGLWQPSEACGFNRSGTRGDAWESGCEAWLGGHWWHTDPAEIPNTNLHDGSHVCGIKLGEKKFSESSKSCEIHKPNDKGTEEKVCTTKPLVGRVANGVANRVDRLKAIGNGQVPQCAAMAFSILSEGLI